MIIGRGTQADGTGELLMLGLSFENLRRLRQGEPIRMTPESHGPGVPLGWKILIVAAETEEALVAALVKAEAVGPATVVAAMPRDPSDPDVH